jgi:NADPH:quinone reductase-like Zn-dependent oxidoreductase
LDIVGAKYLSRNVELLAADGRLVIIGLQGGARAELNLGILMAKRGTLISTTLRARPPEQKAAIVAAVRSGVWPLVDSGQVRPVINCVLPFAEAAAAHRIMTESTHTGKILLTAQ